MFEERMQYESMNTINARIQGIKGEINEFELS